MVKRSVLRNLALLSACMIVSGNALLPAVARAETPLNRAVIQSLRNTVRLILRNQSPRPARVKDMMAPGDALSTARAALAELRFNDGSLARIGGQALFQFVPNTRTFQLSNGTLLLLVPPGRGQTRIQTPNAAAGIRGSALFVRYIPDTDVTLIGALTESGIEVANRDRSQNQPLKAGQIAVVVNNRIEQIYRFDLNTFYETSDLVKGLDLQRPPLPQSEVQSDTAIAAVRAETSEALKEQVRLDATTGIQAEGIQNSTSTQRAVSSDTSRSAEPSPNGVASPTLKLLEPVSVTSPAIVPPTVALPTTTPLADLPPANPMQTGSPLPSGASLGLSRSDIPQLSGPPGLNRTLNRTVPGLTGATPGQRSNLPPGQAGTAPGLAGTTPGRGGSLPPGQAGTAPGLAGTTPGRGGNGNSAGNGNGNGNGDR